MNEGRRHTDNIVRGNYHEEEEMRLKHKTINGNLVEMFRDEREDYHSVFLNAIPVVERDNLRVCDDAYKALCKGLESANNQMKTDVIG